MTKGDRNIGKAKTTGEIFLDDNETEEDLLLALSKEELEIEYNKILGKTYYPKEENE